MTGLYAGIDEAPFKRTAGGWVFQTHNKWLLGSRDRYFVTDAQKSEIAACLRSSIRRVSRYAVGYVLLMILLMGLGIAWLLSHYGSTISISSKDEAGEATTTQFVNATGAKGEFTSGGVAFTYSADGPPGDGHKLSVNQLDASGKIAQTCVFPFAEGAPTTVIVKDGVSGRVVRTIVLAGRFNPEGAHLGFWSALLGIVLLLPLLGMAHAYNYRKLRPLVLGLPRSEEKITWREGALSLARHASSKYLALMLFNALMGFLFIATRSFQGHPALDFVAVLVGVTSMVKLVQFIYLTILRRKTTDGSNAMSGSSLL